MPLTPQLNDYLLCPICFNAFSNLRKPFTLTCSHTCCSSCLKSLQYCPFDQTPIETRLPENEAILGLIAYNNSQQTSQQNSNRDGFQGSKERTNSQSYECVEVNDIPYYRKCIDCIKQLALLLRPQQQNISLSRPMQRKLITLLHCQIIDGEGRTRAMRNARSIGERALAELLIKHQDSHQLSSNLWAAVRARGCQFLGPAMQEEVLRLVLLALEDGSALSRKVLVMFVVQRLSPHFPHQASKTAIGHVIQLLYRASCFKLTKRDGDSSLMQLKEEYCSYEALRREHDTQIVSIALEAGLRISPDQWSSLLYGDSVHKSHMQSIIDKLQSPASFSQSIQEFIIALQRTGDPSDLGAIRQPLEKLALIDPSPTHEAVCHPTHEDLSEALEAAKVITFRLVDFLQQFASSHGVVSNSSNSRTNRFTTGISSNNQRQRVGRVRPLVQHQPTSPQFNSDQFSPINVLSSPRHAPVQQAVRPCASVPPSRIIRATNLAVSPTLAVGPHSILTQTNDISSPDSSQQLSHSNTIHTIPVPVIVASTGSPNMFQSTQTMAASVTCGTASAGPPTLPSEEDQMIPFSDRPFVSKYGPISRLMNLINTPTMAAPGNGMSQQLAPNGINTGARTHPTNVILGRSAVPSLTLIQPLQILTTTFLTDPNPNSQYGRTAFIADPTHYQSSYVSGLIDSADNQMNGSPLT